MTNEKIKILEMIQDGKITAAEGMDLLKAIEEDSSNESQNINYELVKNDKEFSGTKGRFLRVRVSGEKTLRVNVNLPFSLVRSASKVLIYALSFVPPDKRTELEQKGLDFSNLDIEEFVKIIEESVDGKIVDIEVADPVEGSIKVEVYVD